MAHPTLLRMLDYEMEISGRVKEVQELEFQNSKVEEDFFFQIFRGKSFESLPKKQN